MRSKLIGRGIAAVTTKALHRLPPEPAHRVAMRLLKTGLAPKLAGETDPILATNVFGRLFPNPLGLAAGFDRFAEAPDPLLQLGFGFVEVGTFTPRPQPGNPKPRLFRDFQTGALVNRMGFPSRGLEACLGRLESRERRGIVGANVVRNRNSADGVADFVFCISRLALLVDYLAINVSSPNTPGLRDLQEAAALTGLIESCLKARDASRGKCPLLVKIAPDLDEDALQAVANVALRYGIDGLIVSNTSLSRPPELALRLRGEAGGLSGKPLLPLATQKLRATYRMTGGKIPLIGVGGVSSAEDAFEKIRAGASLVQLYTALIFKGPKVVEDITAGLAMLLRQNGFSSVASAVGSGS